MNATQLASAIGSEVTELLAARKARLYEEIRNYPTPIAGCDQQFNYLLEQQSLVIGELAAARQIVARGPSDRDALSLMADFIRSSQSLDATLKRRLLARCSSCDVEQDSFRKC
jgi:hypothetical protein